MLHDFKISYIYFHMLILIQPEDNQTLNDHIIVLSLWLHGTNSKNA
jgi:hypothetical protein